MEEQEVSSSSSSSEEEKKSKPKQRIKKILSSNSTTKIIIKKLKFEILRKSNQKPKFSVLDFRWYLNVRLINKSNINEMIILDWFLENRFKHSKKISSHFWTLEICYTFFTAYNQKLQTENIESKQCRIENKI